MSPQGFSVTERAQDKQEAIDHWNSNPCGSEAGGDSRIGTQAFYDRIDRNRYEEYGPWMRRVIGFDQYTGKRLLEVGFGMGTDLFQFARHGSLVSGIDLTPKHLEIASRRFELAGIPADLRLADAEALPYDDGSFDAVYTFGVIHHTPDTQRAVDEIHRVLRPGGTALIAVYYRWSAFYLFSQLLTNYVIRGNFLHEPLRDTLSRHVEGATEARPLVKLYSRKGVCEMLRSFARVELKIVHLTGEHFGVLRPFIPDDLASRLESRMGWYLIARCTK